MKKAVVCFGAILLLTGCSSHADEIDDNCEDNASEAHTSEMEKTSYNFSVGDQSFEILPFYDEIFNYIDEMKDDRLNNDETFEKTVKQPFRDSLDRLDIAQSYSLRKTVHFDVLEDKTEKLADKQDAYNEWIKEALTKSVKKLPDKNDVTIYLFPVVPEDDAFIDEGSGVSGLTFNREDVLLKVDPSVSKDMLKHVTAHEYYHTVNEEQSPETLIDWILKEGKAEAFASIIYPGTSDNWLVSMSKDEEENILEALEDMELEDADDLEYGNKDKNIPVYSNYKIGYKIMKNYIDQHPDESVADWSDKTAEKIVKNSEYSDLLD